MSKLLFVFLLLISYAGNVWAIPSAYEVQRVALQVAGLTDHSVESWQHQSKWYAALPQLRFTFQRDFDETLKVTNKDNISISSGNVTIGPDENDVVRDFDAGNRFQVMAVWSLDRLVFNRDKLAVSQERRNRFKERMLLIDKVTGYYHERAQALHQLQSLPRMTTKEKNQLYWMARDREAKLDAYTNGWFSAQIERKGNKL